jgi:hypothetical protein
MVDLTNGWSNHQKLDMWPFNRHWHRATMFTKSWQNTNDSLVRISPAEPFRGIQSQTTSTPYESDRSWSYRYMAGTWVPVPVPYISHTRVHTNTRLALLWQSSSRSETWEVVLIQRGPLANSQHNSDRLHVSPDVRDCLECRNYKHTGNYRHFLMGTYDMNQSRGCNAFTIVTTADILCRRQQTSIGIHAPVCL